MNDAPGLNEAALEKAAKAMANNMAAQAGVPPISNPLDIMPAHLKARVLEDTAVAIRAYVAAAPAPNVEPVAWTTPLMLQTFAAAGDDEFLVGTIWHRRTDAAPIGLVPASALAAEQARSAELERERDEAADRALDKFAVEYSAAYGCDPVMMHTGRENWRRRAEAAERALAEAGKALEHEKTRDLGRASPDYRAGHEMACLRLEHSLLKAQEPAT